MQVCLENYKRILICKLGKQIGLIEIGFDLTRLGLEMSLSKEWVILDRLPILRLLMFGSTQYDLYFFI